MSKTERLSETQFFCPHCNNELEKLKACGTTDYFCNFCNQLISKRAIIAHPNSSSIESTGDNSNTSNPNQN